MAIYLDKDIDDVEVNIEVVDVLVVSVRAVVVKVDAKLISWSCKRSQSE
jgi:hypothetical protein